MKGKGFWFKARRFLKLTALVLFLLWGSYFVYKHEIRKMVLFRIPPWEDADIGCGVLVCDLCIFNPLRDRTLENTVQRMIDYLHEKDLKKANKILEELKKNPMVSEKVIKQLMVYKRIRPDVCFHLGKIAPVDYFQKKGEITFVFFVRYCKESPYYDDKSWDNNAAGGSIEINSKTGKIIGFYLGS